MATRTWSYPWPGLLCSRPGPFTHVACAKDPVRIRIRAFGLIDSDAYIENSGIKLCAVYLGVPVGVREMSEKGVWDFEVSVFIRFENGVVG